jgi:peptidoglycan hydrolase CwlO-like protein
MTLLLRQEETMHILNNYQTFTHQELLDHFFKNNNDSDCIYIFNNLPQDFQKKLDDIAGEISKQNVVLLKNLDNLIASTNEQIKNNEEQIKESKERNKILDEMVYKAETELEMMIELNRQLGIY